MTIHLISVGRSILEFMSAPHGRPGVADTLADLIDDSRAVAVIGRATAAETAAQITACLDGTDAALAEKVAKLSRHLRIDEWPAGASAELATFAAAAGFGSARPREDVAVLITSDTTEGLAAALWNALALTGPVPPDATTPARVHYLPDLSAVRGPADLEAAFRPLHVAAQHRSADRGVLAVICRMPGLDASDSAGFRRAMGYLGWLGKGLIDHVQRPGEEFRFYLSGGYKATIPYLIGLAEGVRGLAKARVTAWVLHETTDTVIRLPLRKLAGDVVRSQLAHFTGLVSDREPKGLQLDGYAYEWSDERRRWELTAFGVGLRNLFGLPAETP